MTRKHFRAMAKTIRFQVETAKKSEFDVKDKLLESARETARTFAEISARSNPRFDRNKFYTACGFPA
jgi:hypothetical protein